MRAVLLTSVVISGSLVWAVGAQVSPRPIAIRLPVGGGALAIGDLNRDAHPDIVTSGRDAVIVYLNDGGGRFEQAAGSPFAAGQNPSDVALGDFDEDGGVDIAVANHETNYLSVLLAAAGGFAAPARLVVPSNPHPHGVAAGDFDGDRHLDLAVESWMENTVLVLKGNGKGAFTGEPLRLAVGLRPYHKLRAGDLNGDGVADLVTTNGDGSSVSVSCSGAGGGVSPANETMITRSPFAVAIGDVNGDRRPDLAVAHRWGGVDPARDWVTVLTGQGACRFSATAESPMRAGTSPTAVAVGDVDGDRIDDVAVANMGSDNVSVFLGGRSGVRPAGGAPFPAGKGPTAIAMADLNGDGRADIVTGNATSRDLLVLISR